MSSGRIAAVIVVRTYIKHRAFRHDYLFPPIHLIRWHDRGVPNVCCQHHESREDSAVNWSLRTAVGSFLIGTMSSKTYGANELTLMCNCLSDFLRSHRRPRRPPLPEDSEAWMSIENKYLNSPDVDLQEINLVPPDPYMELTGDQWYEHGVLREWHERRRRGLVGINSTRSSTIWELYNGLVPSYIRSPTRCEQF